MTTQRCSVPGCNAPHLARGCCESHYHKFMRAGTIAQHAGEFTEAVPVAREPWTYEGKEHELIAAQEARDLVARVTRDVMGTLSRQDDLPSIQLSAPAGQIWRTVVVQGVNYVIYGKDEDELDLREQELRARS
jgi:hypothetical protein